jgi:hypothetical protein
VEPAYPAAVASSETGIAASIRSVTSVTDPEQYSGSSIGRPNKTLNSICPNFETLVSLGVQFISYQENIDTGTPLGQAIFTIISAVAQLERNLILETGKVSLASESLHGN